MIDGGFRVKRSWGETFGSAGEEPTDETQALCQSTTYAMMWGQRPAGAPLLERTVVAFSEMSPMIRSAIGLRS